MASGKEQFICRRCFIKSVWRLEWRMYNRNIFFNWFSLITIFGLHSKIWATAPLQAPTNVQSISQEGRGDSNQTFITACVCVVCEHTCTVCATKCLLSTVYCKCQGQCACVCVPAEAHHVHFPDQRGDSGPELLPREERWQIQLHRHGTEAFWAAQQPCSVSSTPDSWGALIRACGWNCTGTQAADGPAEETEDHSVWRWHTARSGSELGCRQHLSLSGISENSSAHIKSGNNPVGLSSCGQRLILFYQRAESRECKLCTWGKRCRDPKAGRQARTHAHELCIIKNPHFRKQTTPSHTAIVKWASCSVASCQTNVEVSGTGARCLQTNPGHQRPRWHGTHREGKEGGAHLPSPKLVSISLSLAVLFLSLHTQCFFICHCVVPSSYLYQSWSFLFVSRCLRCPFISALQEKHISVELLFHDCCLSPSG